MKFSVLFLALSVVLLSRASALPICSATYCGTNGASARCIANDLPTEPTLCYFWALTSDARLSCKALTCNNSCYFIPVYGSDGNPYCTPCHLHKKSCEVRFNIYGPVSRTPNPMSAFPSGGPMAARPVEAAVVAHAERPVEKCSSGLCTSKGAWTGCLFEGNRSTCGKWARTDEKREECSFLCPLLCLPEEARPVDNTGKKHCSRCQLASASCAADFKIYGPVGATVVPGS